MEDRTPDPPKRRALLQRSALLIGGAIGLGGVARSTSAETPPNPDEGRTLRLLGKRGPQSRAVRGSNGGATVPSAHGELLALTGGERVGSFHSSGLGQAAPLHGLAAAPKVELQTFTLEDGTLFGLGAAAGRDGERTCAVLGGTGRFAGASGTYTERPATGADAPRGAVEFIFTLKA